MFFSHFFGSSTDSLQISLDFHQPPGDSAMAPYRWRHGRGSFDAGGTGRGRQSGHNRWKEMVDGSWLGWQLGLGNVDGDHLWPILYSTQIIIHSVIIIIIIY